jgi:hypothetical protein
LGNGREDLLMRDGLEAVREGAGERRRRHREKHKHKRGSRKHETLVFDLVWLAVSLAANPLLLYALPRN